MANEKQNRAVGAELVEVPNGDVDIKSRILTVSGVQVMLDRDLAELYGVELKVLNQAVKRNAMRFPERFMHQLSKTEFDDLKSQIATSSSDSSLLRLKSQFVTSSWGGVRKLPKVFTEQGVSMLSAVLRSPMAIDMSIRIMDAFVAMRHFLQANGAILQRIETVEVKQLAMGNQLNKILDAMQDKILPSHQIFYQGQFWDAKSLLIRFIRRAKKELIVIDAYPGVATLDILAKRGRGVKVELVTHSNGELAESDFEAFAKQCGNFTKTICGICHDRFIIVDQKEMFFIGASLKDAGRLTFAVAKMNGELIPNLISSVRKATSTTNCYA